jgi:hypothetical protein
MKNYTCHILNHVVSLQLSKKLKIKYHGNRLNQIRTHHSPSIALLDLL